MFYKKFKNTKPSRLALGCMRLPQTADGKIDEEAVFKMVDYAIENGVNYFDTAYGYHGGESEIVTGKALNRHPRESFYIATKFPGFSEDLFNRHDEVFNRQLEKTGMEHFDFYLLHCVSDWSINYYIKSDGVIPYLMEKRKQGIIGHLGFSAHCSFDTLKRLLEAFGSELEFCQLQINWIDWEYQDAKAKVELLSEYGIPVWVMEPLRGGKLASLSEKGTAEIRKIRDVSPIETSFRFLQAIPQVETILSGMSNMDQLRQNIEIFSEEKPLSNEEAEKLIALGRDIMHGIPCTSCRYCVSECPMGIDIPTLFSLYNEQNLTDEKISGRVLNDWKIDREKWPDKCLGCGACAAVCPQSIDIPGILTQFADRIVE